MVFASVGFSRFQTSEAIGTGIQGQSLGSQGLGVAISCQETLRGLPSPFVARKPPHEAHEAKARDVTVSAKGKPQESIIRSMLNPTLRRSPHHSTHENSSAFFLRGLNKTSLLEGCASVQTGNGTLLVILRILGDLMGRTCRDLASYSSAGFKLSLSLRDPQTLSPHST